MPRKNRHDEPGAFHHVMNRGLSRRTVFETRRDMRTFLALLARAVVRHEILVHAFCVLQNHFHLLLSSPCGELSRAMRRMAAVYVRYFNRTRHRDGPLFRGRFRSKPVETLAYRRILVRYIDDNPVSAGLARAARLYPWGSAIRYASDDGPRWLDRSWVESEVARHARAARYAPRDYDMCFPCGLSPAVREWVERRILVCGGCETDELDDLLRANPAETLAWLERRAWSADHTKPGLPIASAGLLDGVLARRPSHMPDWRLGRRRRRPEAMSVVRLGLLRDMGGYSIREIAMLECMPRSTVQDRLELHAAALASDECYRARCASIARDTLAELRRAAEGLSA